MRIRVWSAGIALGIALLTPSARAQGQVVLHYRFDEFGNGRTWFTGLEPAMPPGDIFGMPAYDYGPGGMNTPAPGFMGPLTYSFAPPNPSYVVGDLFILEPGGGVSDVIRFNPAFTPPYFGAPTLVFYSENTDGVISMADLGFPTANWPTTFSVVEQGTEGWNWATYTPEPGQPGYITDMTTTYEFISETPEPASLTLLGTGLVGLVGLARRRRHAA